MSADEQPRRIRANLFADPPVVAARVASDMSHPDIEFFAVEPLVFRMKVANGSIIDVSIHASEGLELSQLPNNVHSSEIAGVPDFIAVFEILEDQWIEETVCIRDESDSLHDA